MDRIKAPLLMFAVVFMLSPLFSTAAVAAATPSPTLPASGTPQWDTTSGTELSVKDRLTADLQQIGLAMQNYHDANGHYPPAYVAGANGQPLFSWRVLLLPYLGQQALFDQFDTSKAWNDPANRVVLHQMPDVFRGPLAPRGSVFTQYAGVAGPNTVFDCVQARATGTACAGTPRTAITDGTSNTVIVGEVAQAQIPWTAPDDVDIRTHPILGARGGFSGVLADGVPFAFADGSVQFLPYFTPSDTLHAFFTINGGEPTVQDRLTADLQQIGLAMQNYHDANGHYPPAYVAGANGQPLFSWRVLLLPYLGQQALFNQFDISKAWNDPANLAVLQQMPDVFRGPWAPDWSIFTHYAGVAGPSTVFDCVQARATGTACVGTRRADITDGTSNTVAVGEVAQALIPWSMPDDVDIRAHPTLGERGGFSGVLADGVPFAFADGSVRFLPNSTLADTLHAYFTINGGEAIP